MKLSVIGTVLMLAGGPAAVDTFAQATTASQAKPSDRELSDQIARAIANDSALSADAVKVTVEGGVVTLTGMVGTDADKTRAEKLARVAGVTRVENNLKSREKATGAVKGSAGAVADASKKGAAKTKNALSKTGEVITDGWISTRIKTNFAGEDVLSGSDIKVDTNNNVVTLSGTVPTAAGRTRALAIAKEVEGVRRVIDKLSVTTKGEAR